MTIEAFLDETPGEVRGVIVRDGLYHHLLIQRESDDPRLRLSARSVGRITELAPTLKGAFVDLGGVTGFLPLRKDRYQVGQGARIEVEISAEPHESKAAALRLIGAGEGEPRLSKAAPGIAEQLAALVPGVEIETGATAVRAALEAEVDAMATGAASGGVDVAVQRTRALVAVDMDFAGAPGRDSGVARRQANLRGLREAARIIRLKRWGGLVAIDLIGTGHEADILQAGARAAFGADPEIVFGPINRFGVLMLSLPWGRRPVEEILNDAAGRATLETRGLDVVRRLRLAMLSDTASPRLIARCAPEEAAFAGPLTARLGPRAGIRSDPEQPAGRCRIEEA